MKKIKLKCFGAFRKYVHSGEIMMSVPENINVAEFKDLLVVELKKTHPEFSETTLIHDSALATEEKVLTLHEPLSGENFAILPPVCGG